MSWLSRLFRGGTPDTDLDDEIRFHLDQEVQLRVDRGEPRDQARHGARRDFGNVIVVMETTRQMWGWTPMALLDDLKHAYRRLRSRPAMMVAAASMLALGVGLTTGMFTVIDALMLRPAPFRDSDRLANLMMLTPNGGRTDVSPAVLEAWRASSAFAAAEGATTETSLIDTSAGPRVAASARVSPGMFAMLGTPPIRGRGFDPTDGRPGTDDRVILSEDVWRAVFGADPNLIGQRVTIDGTSMLVIGLMPSGFRFPRGTRSSGNRSTSPLRRRPFRARHRDPSLRARGLRRADGRRTANCDGGGSSRGFVDPGDRTSHEPAPGRRGTRPVLSPRRAAARRRSRPGVPGAVRERGQLLLLARLGARQQEFRMCSALGASRARLLREALIEHGLLGVGSIGLGVVLAWGLVSLARAFLPQAFLVSTLHAIDLDPRALVVAVVAGLVATLAAGVLPAWMGTRPDRASSLTSSGRGGTENRAARTLTRALLVAELALACTLLVGATLLVRSFINLATVDPGLHVEGVLTTWIALPAKGFPDRPSRVAITAALEDNIRQLPGVERIALSTGLPPGGGATYFYDDWQGDGPDARPLHMEVGAYGVGPDFFDLYGIPLLRGRTFQAGDGPDDVIVGERMAARLWPGQNPVGRTFHFNQERQGGHVVGLAREIRLPSLEAFPRPAGVLPSVRA